MTNTFYEAFRVKKKKTLLVCKWFVCVCVCVCVCFIFLVVNLNMFLFMIFVYLSTDALFILYSQAQWPRGSELDL